MDAELKTFMDLTNASESALRAELNIHGYEPSEVISKEILINMLMTVYFGGDRI